MIGANLQGLVSSHHQSSLSTLLVLQESDVSSSTFLPLATLTIESEQLGTHLEHLFLVLLVGLGLDLFCQQDNGLKVRIWLGLIRCFLLSWFSIKSHLSKHSYLVGLFLGAAAWLGFLSCLLLLLRCLSSSKHAEYTVLCSLGRTPNSGRSTRGSTSDSGARATKGGGDGGLGVRCVVAHFGMMAGKYRGARVLFRRWGRVCR
jgi:hypothetical protein